MKKVLILSLILISSLISKAQYIGYRNNPSTVTGDTYVTNSPGNGIFDSKNVVVLKDSTWMKNYYPTVQWMKYSAGRDDGTPFSVLWTDGLGNMKVSPFPSFNQVQSDWNANTGLGKILNKPVVSNYYGPSGAITNQIKVWVGNVVPNTATGYSVNISSAGFSTILSAQITGYENLNTIKGVVVSGVSTSTSAIVVNLYRSKTTGVLLLNTQVEGLEIHPSPANVTLHIEVIGY